MDGEAGLTALLADPTRRERVRTALEVAPTAQSPTPAPVVTMSRAHAPAPEPIAEVPRTAPAPATQAPGNGMKADVAALLADPAVAQLVAGLTSMTGGGNA